MKMLNAMTLSEFRAIPSGTTCHVADFQLLKPVEVVLYKSDRFDCLWTITMKDNQFVHLREVDGHGEGYNFASFKKNELYQLIQDKNYFILHYPLTKEDI